MEKVEIVVGPISLSLYLSPALTSLIATTRLHTAAAMTSSSHVPAAPIKRGAADPVFLHFSSFSELSLHRTCTHQHDTSAEGGAGPEQYELLVRQESKRRGLAACGLSHQLPAALLDAAYRSVVNAASRAHSTNDAEFQRLQRCAIKRRASTKTKKRRLHEAMSNAIPTETLKPEWPAFLRSLEDIAPIPSIINDDKPLTEVQRIQHLFPCSFLSRILIAGFSSPCCCRWTSKCCDSSIITCGVVFFSTRPCSIGLVSMDYKRQRFHLFSLRIQWQHLHTTSRRPQRSRPSLPA